MKIESVTARAFKIPTASGTESDGTFEWDATTIVIVEVSGGGVRGLGYTYADASAAVVVESMLRKVVVGESLLPQAAAPSNRSAAPRHDEHAALGIQAHHEAMRAAVRNNGDVGVCAMAISAVDVALWDLCARSLGVSISALIGLARTSVEAYGSDGFTSDSIDELAAHMRRYAERGFASAKMKVGREPSHDVARVRAARRALDSTRLAPLDVAGATQAAHGSTLREPSPGKAARRSALRASRTGKVALFVDANGAYERKQAIDLARRFASLGVTWLEEPVPSHDVDGLRFIREHAPAKVEIAAGEYAWHPRDALRLLEARAVDVLQADVTRCGGFTGFLAIDALCRAFHVPLSAHCAPAISVHACCAAPSVRNLEYFRDHEIIEAKLFGASAPAVDARGQLAPRMEEGVRGHGLVLDEAAAAPFLVRIQGDEKKGKP